MTYLSEPSGLYVLVLALMIKSTLVGAIALVLGGALRRFAAMVNYGYWLMVFLVFAVVLVFSTGNPGLIRTPLPNWVVPASGPYAGPPLASTDQTRVVEPAEAPAENPPVKQFPGDGRTSPSKGEAGFTTTADFKTMVRRNKLATGWLLGFLVTVAWFKSRWHRFGKAISKTALPQDSIWRTDLARLGFRGEGKGRALVVQSADIKAPFIWGFWRPQLVLPASGEKLARDDREVMLRHELVHLKRHDPLLNGISHWLCCLFWFQPLIWIARRQLIAYQERSCDDLVLSQGVPGWMYAQTLLRVGNKENHEISNFGHSSIPLAQGLKLRERIDRVLVDGPPRQVFSKGQAGKVLALSLPFLLPLGMADLRPRTGDSGTATAPPAQSHLAVVKPARPPRIGSPAIMPGQQAAQNHEDISPLLIEALHAGEASIRLSALQELRRRGGPEALPHLVARLEDEEGPIRILAMQILREDDHADAEAAFIRCLGDPSPVVRGLALLGLRDQSGSRRITAVAETLDDPDPANRLLALRILRESKDRSALPAVLRATKDSDPVIRQFAITTALEMEALPQASSPSK